MKKAYGIIAAAAVLALILGITAIILLNANQPDASQTPTPTSTAPNQTPTASTPTQSPTLSPSPTPTTYHGVPVYNYSIVHTYPHDSSAFTQGLDIDEGGKMFESTGLNGASSLRRVNLADGQIMQQYNLPYEYFGEGIAVVEDKIVQLTWQNRIGFVYDKETFELLGNFSYNTEGWGLTYDGNRLIMSDGSSTLYFLDANTYQTIGSINVHDGNGPVEQLNELEYINDTIYANIWKSSKIAVINPTSGQVEAYIDLADTAQHFTAKDPNAVLNGIAYNSQTNQLFVTGKYWSSLYEIQLQKTG
ncbi:MAG: glutaminyl-peptide cyclotransferase [Candidatus Bathyarchaeia archaeon]|jgi:glutamine cyclotransferase